MKKNPKDAFGIVQDGRTIRIVHLAKKGGETYLMGMDTYEMEKDWYKSEDAMASGAHSDFIPSDTMYLDMDNLDSDTDPGSSGFDMNTNSDMGIDFGMDESMNFGMDGDMGVSLAPDSGFGEPGTQSTDQAPQPAPMEVDPLSVLFGKYPLSQGVISVNIHQHHIVKDEPGKVKKSDQKRFRKSILDKAQRKAGDWKSCVLETPEGKQHWLHTGPNLLLEELIRFGKEAQTKLYFQFADANDIILKNYFYYMTGAQEGLNLFIYLGVESREVFVFEDGKWISTLPLQIPQVEPEVDVVYSKLALALDNAQLGEPNGVWIAGDWASAELCDYVKAQGIAAEVSLLKYPYLNMGSPDFVFGEEEMAQFALPLAVACKALNYGTQDFCLCNFLPDKIVDGQKELRVVWHGFIVLTLIFILVTYSTMRDLDQKKSLRKINQEMKVLDFSLNSLRAQSSIVDQLSLDIARYKEVTGSVVDKLQDKNGWTELFDLLNTSFASLPESWLTNLKKNGERVNLSGTTTSRTNVSKLAAKLPGCKINSVSMAELRGQKIWNFEMEIDMPKVNWEELIASEYTPLPVETKTGGTTETPRQYRPAQATQTVEKQEAPRITSKTYRYGILPRIDAAHTPAPADGDINDNEENKELYDKFTKAISKGNMLEYQFIGHVLIEKNEGTRLASLVRWWVAYRLYLDGQYQASHQSLKPNLKQSDPYYLDSALLEARLAFALKDTTFMSKYQSLLASHSQSLAAKQARIDLKIIEEELRR